MNDNNNNNNNNNTTNSNKEEKQDNTNDDTKNTKNTNATTTTNTNNDFIYMNGLNNEFESEIIPGALPKHRNNPRIVPYNLYTEQLSGTAFTVSPRIYNHRTWMYRIEPSVMGRTYTRNDSSIQYFGYCHPKDCIPTIEPIRWMVPPSSLLDSIRNKTTATTTSSSSSDTTTSPNEEKAETTATTTNNNNDSNNNNNQTSCSTKKMNFIDGMILMCTAGDLSMKQGINIYMYTNVNDHMSSKNQHFCNTDGDFLIVPQRGNLIIYTELGKLHIRPTEICVLPRGITFQINLDVTKNDTAATTNNDNDNVSDKVLFWRGYVLEVSSGGCGFQLPDLGPIGSNGLANVRDFQIPTAWVPPCCTNKETYYKELHIVYQKMDHQLVPVTVNHTPYNVIAWHGNYVPYKYNLHYFCTINSVSYDHIDPSIYTVLTCPSSMGHGIALVDFVLFPPRMIVTDNNTFRPPWYHKNTMSEYMGLLYGQYDAKEKGGFVPGGASLHNCMTPHGPDLISYQKAVKDPCEAPTKLDNGMAFMFETYLPMRVSPIALSCTNNWRDVNYNDCWQHHNNDNDVKDANEFTGWDLLQSL